MLCIERHLDEVEAASAAIDRSAGKDIVDTLKALADNVMVEDPHFARSATIAAMSRAVFAK